MYDSRYQDESMVKMPKVCLFLAYVQFWPFRSWVNNQNDSTFWYFGPSISAMIHILCFKGMKFELGLSNSMHQQCGLDQQ
jgi:hypothetical protein